MLDQITSFLGPFLTGYAVKKAVDKPSSADGSVRGWNTKATVMAVSAGLLSVVGPRRMITILRGRTTATKILRGGGIIFLTGSAVNHFSN
jgi:hypothetical protein